VGQPTQPFESSRVSGHASNVGPESALSDWVDNNTEMKKLKKQARDAVKKGLLHRAIGLLCYAGVHGDMSYMGFLGQKLQLALDALDVDLVI
jgi:hypothetical protein